MTHVPYVVLKRNRLNKHFLTNQNLTVQTNIDVQYTNTCNI